MSCPLCKSEKTTVIEKIAAGDLIKLYKSKFGLDTGYLFKSESVDFLFCGECHLKYFSPYSGGDEKFYEYFQKYSWYYLEEKNEYDYAAKFIGHADKVLEVGSGKGVFAKKIASKDYTGLEYSKTACELAAQNGIRVLNESVENHAAANTGKYDVVCHFQVLEHVENIHSFLRSCADCLKPGGRLILSVPSEDTFLKYAVNPYLNLPPHHASRWSDQTLNNLAKIFNLEMVSLYHEKLDSIHELFYFRTLAENALRKIFGIKFRLVNLSFKQKIIKIKGFLMAKYLVKGLREEMKPRGHSVVAIFKKL